MFLFPIEQNELVAATQAQRTEDGHCSIVVQAVQAVLQAPEYILPKPSRHVADPWRHNG